MMLNALERLLSRLETLHEWAQSLSNSNDKGTADKYSAVAAALDNAIVNITDAIDNLG